MKERTLRASASTLNNRHWHILTSTASIIRDISYKRGYCQHKDVHSLIWQIVTTFSTSTVLVSCCFYLFNVTHFTVTKI
jgi:hypothetical protein